MCQKSLRSVIGPKNFNFRFERPQSALKSEFEHIRNYALSKAKNRLSNHRTGKQICTLTLTSGFITGKLDINRKLIKFVEITLKIADDSLINSKSIFNP